jgi:preprotein translocase subunit SecD
MRKQIWYLVGITVIVLGTFLATVIAQNTPVLGLDLQGGISVVLAPAGKFKKDTLDVAVNIIRQRVDARGVAEPQISRTGNTIVIDLPGVKDRSKAQRLVGRTAELRFRPVLATFAAPTKSTPKASSTTTTAKGTTTTKPGATTTTKAATTTTKAGAAASATSSSTTTTTQAPATPPVTPLEQDTANATVILPGRHVKGQPDVLYQLGPAQLTGKGVSSASSSFNTQDQWGVDLTMKSDGMTAFNKMAAAQFGKPPPTNQVAIELDGVVQSAPQFNTSHFDNNQVRISGSFSQGEASDLARLLRFGALPVQLKQLTSENVSPTLGRDQLRSGLAAGILGVALVALYMIVYYRLLGLVVWAGIVLSGMALYTLVTYLGSSVGLTLSLAGITGIIVSLGVTVDSYVVYYERLKDEVRSGKTIRSSVDRGFTRAFRTIVAADLVSLLSALVLYLLAVGSVRGFAFFLGLSTALDLIVAFFFMHPIVSLLARRPHLLRGPFGIAAGLDVREAVA